MSKLRWSLIVKKKLLWVMLITLLLIYTNKKNMEVTLNRVLIANNVIHELILS